MTTHNKPTKWMAREPGEDWSPVRGAAFGWPAQWARLVAERYFENQIKHHDPPHPEPMLVETWCPHDGSRALWRVTGTEITTIDINAVSVPYNEIEPIDEDEETPA